jgi:hypothetical protein
VIVSVVGTASVTALDPLPVATTTSVDSNHVTVTTVVVPIVRVAVPANTIAVSLLAGFLIVTIHFIFILG